MIIFFWLSQLMNIILTQVADIKVEDLPPPPPKIEENIADLPSPPEEDSKTLANPFGDPGDPAPVPSSQPPKLVTEVPTPPEDAIIDEDTKNVELTLDLVTIKEPEPPLSPPSDEDSSVEVKKAPAAEEGFSGIFINNNLDPTAGQMAAAVSVSDLNTEQAKEESKSDSSPEDEAPKTGGLGAALFGTSDEPMAGGTGGTGAGLFADLPTPPEEIGQVKGSTGDAIFADMPSVPGGTGANIFGTSEESARDTTGAKIFDVAAPREAKPELGSMTGWDAAFDSKFDSVKGTNAFDFLLMSCFISF